MKKLLVFSLAFTLTVVQAYGLGARPPGVTGDRGFDSILQNLTVSANADPNGYYRELSARNGIPEQHIRQAKDRYGLNYSDLYMASALAKATHRPILTVAEDYHQNRAKGWGVMAKKLGIKPGSDEFQAMKTGALGSLDHMKSGAKNKQKHEQAMKKEPEQKMKQGEQEKVKQDQQAKKNSQNKGQGTTR
jgi:hypothetical protein